jgi:hypothetical protein
MAAINLPKIKVIKMLGEGSQGKVCLCKYDSDGDGGEDQQAAE